MSEQLHFSISGEWLCDILRTWFWDENRGFEKCEGIIADCVESKDPDIIRNITRDILEYRKVFKGMNSFELVDDPGPVRPITDKLKDIETKLGISEIRQNMQSNFRPFVDEWATLKSMHPEALRCNGDPKTYDEFVQYLGTAQTTSQLPIKTVRLSQMKDPQKCGLWLYDDIPLVYHITKTLGYKPGSFEFWNAIYQEKKNDPDFADRTARYEAHLRRLEEKNRPISETEYQKATAQPQPSSNKLETADDYRTWFQEEYEKSGDINYRMEPDDILFWEGLIAPNGDFYSCTFGGHNVKAYHLMRAFPNKFGFTSEKEQAKIQLTDDMALDAITRHGWCATRTNHFGPYIELPAQPRRLTQRQKDRIYDAMLKHDIHININDIYPPE